MENGRGRHLLVPDDLGPRRGDAPMGEAHWHWLEYYWVLLDLWARSFGFHHFGCQTIGADISFLEIKSDMGQARWEDILACLYR